MREKCQSAALFFFIFTYFMTDSAIIFLALMQISAVPESSDSLFPLFRALSSFGFSELLC